MYFYGENPYRRSYNAEYRKRVSFVLLYWITLELKPVLALAPQGTGLGISQPARA
jgi:hypothetical protein